MRVVPLRERGRERVLALGPRPLRLRGPQHRGPPHPPDGVPGRRVGRGGLARGAGGGRGGAAQGGAGARPGGARARSSRPRSRSRSCTSPTKLARGLGTDNIDHHFRALDSRARFAGAPWLGMTVAELGGQQAVLLVGSTIRKEHPLLASRLRQGAKKGLALSVVHVAGDDLADARGRSARGAALGARRPRSPRWRWRWRRRPASRWRARSRRRPSAIAATDEARAIAKSLVGRERASRAPRQLRAAASGLRGARRDRARDRAPRRRDAGRARAERQQRGRASSSARIPLAGGLDTRAMVAEPAQGVDRGRLRARARRGDGAGGHRRARQGASSSSRSPPGAAGRRSTRT